jgi:glyoxylase-like metal-dependent hydrolase (beta-lactamase superfamily II)
LKGIHLLTGQGVTSNVYVFSGETITLVDSGNGAVENRIIPQLKEIFLTMPNVSKTILTHFHFDHIGGLTELMEAYVLDILIHNVEVSFLHNINSQRIRSLNTDDKVVMGEYFFDIIHTPGHSPGSVCLYEKKMKLLISGDTVFPNGSFGRYDFPFGNHKALLQSLKRLTEIDVKMMLPGHGLPTFSQVNEQIQLSLMTAIKYSS